jgi:hypothetical protein
MAAPDAGDCGGLGRSRLVAFRMVVATCRPSKVGRSTQTGGGPGKWQGRGIAILQDATQARVHRADYRELWVIESFTGRIPFIDGILLARAEFKPAQPFAAGTVLMALSMGLSPLENQARLSPA